MSSTPSNAFSWSSGNKTKKERGQRIRSTHSNNSTMSVGGASIVRPDTEQDQRTLRWYDRTLRRSYTKGGFHFSIPHAEEPDRLPGPKQNRCLEGISFLQMRKTEIMLRRCMDKSRKMNRLTITKSALQWIFKTLVKSIRSPGAMAERPFLTCTTFQSSTTVFCRASHPARNSGSIKISPKRHEHVFYNRLKYWRLYWEWNEADQMFGYEPYG